MSSHNYNKFLLRSLYLLANEGAAAAANAQTCLQK